MRKEELMCLPSLQECKDLGSEARYYHDSHYFYKVFDEDALDLDLKEKKCRWLLEREPIDELLPLVDLIWEEGDFVGHVTRFLPNAIPIYKLWDYGQHSFYEEAVYQSSLMLERLHKTQQIFVSDMHFGNVLLDQEDGNLYFGDFDSYIINKIPSLLYPDSLDYYFWCYVGKDPRTERSFMDHCQCDKLSFLLSYLDDTMHLPHYFKHQLDMLEELEKRNFTKEGLRVFEQILSTNPKTLDLPYFYEIKKEKKHPSLVLVK